jgi:hypothetical protein
MRNRRERIAALRGFELDDQCLLRSLAFCRERVSGVRGGESTD